MRPGNPATNRPPAGRARAGLVFTCEHASRSVPRPFAGLFASARARAALNSHRGFDIGALNVARALARRFKAPCLAAMFTRLLVDPNRSPHHADVFSEFSARLSDDEWNRVLVEYYQPHRHRVFDALKRTAERRGRVIHIAVHSFTPRLHGTLRNAEVSLLYDPARKRERRFSVAWQRELERRAPELRVRRNYPYRGAADGLTTNLREAWPASRYLGIELEVNQALVRAGANERRRLVRVLGDSLAEVIGTAFY